MNILPTFAPHQVLPTRFGVSRFGVAISILFGTVTILQSASAAGIEDFMGVKWGVSKEEAQRIMLARLREKAATEAILFFRKGHMRHGR